MKKKIKLSSLIDIPYLIAAGAVFSLAYNMFLTPGNVIVGGVGGIATVLNYLYGWGTGLMLFLLNLPLLIGFMAVYGIRSSVKSIVGIAVGSFMVDALAMLNILSPAFGAVNENNKLLYAIFGGITLGAAIGLFFTRGYTTGGTDIIALLLKPRIKKFSTARLILFVDTFIITLSAVILKDWKSVLYSFVAIFMSTNTLNIVTGGFDKGALVYIFSKKSEEIADKVYPTIGRGVSMIDGMGWYTKKPEKVVLCVVKKSQLYQLKLLAKTIDPKSFIIVSETTETIGLGFKENVGDRGFEEKKTKTPDAPVSVETEVKEISE